MTRKLVPYHCQFCKKCVCKDHYLQFFVTLVMIQSRKRNFHHKKYVIEKITLAVRVTLIT